MDKDKQELEKNLSEEGEQVLTPESSGDDRNSSGEVPELSQEERLLLAEMEDGQEPEPGSSEIPQPSGEALSVPGSLKVEQVLEYESSAEEEDQTGEAEDLSREERLLLDEMEEEQGTDTELSEETDTDSAQPEADDGEISNRDSEEVQPEDDSVVDSDAKEISEPDAPVPEPADQAEENSMPAEDATVMFEPPTPNDAESVVGKEKFVLNLDEETLNQDVIETKKKGRNKKKRRVVKQKIHPAGMAFRVILSIVIIAAAVAASIFVVTVVQDIMGFGGTNDIIVIEVSENETLKDVAGQLEEKGVIRSADLFRAFIKYTKKSPVIQYGTFELMSSMAYSDILSELEEADQSSDVRITIIEGETIQSIAKKLEENKVCTADSFIDVINNEKFLNDEGKPRFSFVAALDDIPGIEDRPYRLEGYIFPDTYEFKTRSDAKTVVSKILRNFNKKYDEWMVYQTKNIKINGQQATIDDIVILASIIQAEAGVEKEMKNVSGVYWNRLKNPGIFPKLQADPTIHYGNSLREADVPQAVIDQYNAYKCEGLPLGAINNPGLMALKAALEPTESNYFYFLTDVDMTTFYYAETYEQHQKNEKKAGLKD